MIAAISPEGYLFIVGGLAFLCTPLVFALAAVANVTLNRRRAWRRVTEEVERFREELDREDAVRVIGGGNLHAPVEERRAA